MQPLEPSIQPRARVVIRMVLWGVVVPLAVVVLAVIGFVVWNLGFEHY
jgi:hypothetical protein